MTRTPTLAGANMVHALTGEVQTFAWWECAACGNPLGACICDMGDDEEEATDGSYSS